jgi:hypothetical protein
MAWWLSGAETTMRCMRLWFRLRPEPPVNLCLAHSQLFHVYNFMRTDTYLLWQFAMNDFNDTITSCRIVF